MGLFWDRAGVAPKVQGAPAMEHLACMLLIITKASPANPKPHAKLEKEKKGPGGILSPALLLHHL
jgi:hypothetical protein